jgi:hypothetical protein
VNEHGTLRDWRITPARMERYGCKEAAWEGGYMCSALLRRSGFGDCEYLIDTAENALGLTVEMYSSLGPG